MRDEGDWEGDNQRGHGFELMQMEKRNRFFICLKLCIIFFLYKKEFKYRRPKQISSMDMYANLGDEEDTLWGFE